MKLVAALVVGSTSFASLGQDVIVAAVQESGATNADLYLFEGDFTTPVNVTADLAIDIRSPSLSPDGRRVAFISINASGNREIHLINTDGSGHRTIAELFRTEVYGWLNPTEIAYRFATGPGSGSIRALNVDTGAGKEKTSHKTTDNEQEVKTTSSEL